jgi:tRNA-binding EMAP/Myf-like protein
VGKSPENRRPDGGKCKTSAISVPYPTMSEWICGDCEYENTVEDAVCGSCEASKPKEEGGSTSDGPFLIIGHVQEVTKVPNKDTLKVVKVDIGKGEPITLVSSAAVYPDVYAVIALPGATVKIEGEDVLVKKATVGGVASHGMLCDCPMLQWTGGGAGTVATVPKTSFKIGEVAPTSRPRGDGK